MLRPNTNTRSNGIPIDDDLEAVIVLMHVSDDGGVTWIPSISPAGGGGRWGIN